jgi:hypothetical protein
MDTVCVNAQQDMDTTEGIVSYKTTQNIYVRFTSTQGISVGDTLYFIRDGIWWPVLVVKFISSTSCVGAPMISQNIEPGTKIIAQVKTQKKPVYPDEKKNKEEIIPEEEVVTEKIEETQYSQKTPSKKTDHIKGRISAASYINMSGHPANDRQRMKYTLTFNARRIGNTGFSAECYMSFRHTLNDWQEVKDHFNKVFKVYSLAAEYEFNEGLHVWLGRKINFNLSNIGAIDGLQAEKKWKKTLVGFFAGSKPDLSDYGFNSHLLQFGAYTGYTIQEKNGIIQNTFAIAEQRNHNLTDRRFAYFQHVNSSIKRINIFSSFEFDLYKVENDVPKNVFDVSSIYFSIRYRASDKLSLFGSYDARKNIIYYESYKSFIDQLIDEETRQGFRFSFNYHPLKKLTIGSSAGYRFQKNNPNPSENLYSYLTLSRIPNLGISATASTVLIRSQYLSGIIYGLRLSRDFLKGKIYGEVEYRIVKYKYQSLELPLNQSIAGTNLSWRITKMLSFNVSYEGEFQNKNLTSRIYTNVIHRL